MQFIIKRDGKTVTIEGDEVEALSRDGTIFSLYAGEKHGELRAQEWTDDQNRIWRRIGSCTMPLRGDIS